MKRIPLTRYEKGQRITNIGFEKWRVECFYDSLVQGLSSVFQLNICAENPTFRKAENHFMLFNATPK